MATEAKRVNIFDIFIIEGYECNCLTILTSMLIFMSFMLLTVKPVNNTRKKERLKEVTGMERGLDSEENPHESQKYSPDFFFFQQYYFAPKCFLLGLNLSTFFVQNIWSQVWMSDFKMSAPLPPCPVTNNLKQKLAKYFKKGPLIYKNVL